jgi:hypothetical protein
LLPSSSLLQHSSLPSLCLCLSLFNLQGLAMDRNSERMLLQGMHAARIGARRGCAALKERECERRSISRKRHGVRRCDGFRYAGAAPRRACRHRRKILLTTCICRIGSHNRSGKKASDEMIAPQCKFHPITKILETLRKRFIAMKRWSSLSS